MNTSNDIWDTGEDTWGTKDVFTRYTTQNTSGWFDEKFCEYIEPERWTTARGSGKSTMGELVKYLARIYAEDTPNKNATVFCKNSVPMHSKLPDSYPKGNLDDLLGVGDA